MITPDNIPDNTVSDQFQFDLSSVQWVIIGILICVIIILTIILIRNFPKPNQKNNSPHKNIDDKISEEESGILQKYRTLNDRDKAVINATLKTLSNNAEQPKE